MCGKPIHYACGETCGGLSTATLVIALAVPPYADRWVSDDTNGRIFKAKHKQAPTGPSLPSG
jgi:hypothetical protein